MPSAMTIAIIGGGAVGSYYAALLARAGNQVRLLARGSHLDVIRREGLRVAAPTESYVVDLDATDRGDALIGAEYALLTVKGFHIAEVAPLVRRLALGGTTIVPLLNGVDIADRLVEAGVAREQILEGLTTVSVVRTAPGVVERRSAFQRIVLGESNGEASARAVDLAALLNAAALETRISPDIRLDLWRKFVFLAPMAAVCGLRRAPIGEVLTTAEGRELLAQAVREVIAVGRAVGVSWAPQEEASTLAAISALPFGMKPSFLVDVERGGPTELDTLSGTVVRLGRSYDISTPVHAEVIRAFS